MVKLTQDSVGKVYVDSDGGKHKVFAIHPNLEGVYVSATEDSTVVGIGVWHDNGLNMVNHTGAHLMSEYTPPRTKDEILDDLVAIVRHHQLNCINKNTSCYQITEALIKEAKQTLENE